MNTAKSQDPAVYLVQPVADDDDTIIAHAVAILARRLKTGTVFARPSDVKHFCQLQLATRKHEVFGVLFLDANNSLIEFREMFRGTLTEISVYPREVVIECLELSAAGVVFTHNHPSGSVQPSRADESLTQTLKAALALVEVRVLDHIIVGLTDTLSMAEKGLL